MYKFIFDKILSHRLLITILFAAGCAWGAASLVSLPIDAVPDITNVQVMINTKTGALDPEKIEKTVTAVVETEMLGLPGLDDVRSLSKYGLSQVVLIFKDGTDIYFVRSQVAQRLQNLKDLLPGGLTPELAPVTTGLGEIVMYTVNAKPGSDLEKQPEGRRLLYLRTIQDYVIRPQLKKVNGVAEIDSSGGFKKEIHINADTRKMEQYGITFEDLHKKLQTLGDNYGGGYIQRDGKQIIVRTSSQLPSLKTIEEIPVKIDIRGRAIPLGMIAGVREDHALRLGAATHNGHEAVLGTALMYIGANSREVSIDVVKALKTAQLPDDVEARVVYTRSFLVNQTIKTVAKSLAEGAALVVIVLLLLLGNLRAALLVAVSIPISMLFAVGGMKFFGISANLMSLGAIDFGLLVDGSVVMIENLLRRFHQHTGELSLRSKLELVKLSALEVAKPVVLGLCIIMVVYVPILSLNGIEGKMFHPMAMTVLMAIGASLLVAILLMPVLGVLLLRKPRNGEPHKEPKIFAWISQAYDPILHWGLRHGRVLMIATVAFGVASAFLFTRLGSDFVPKLDEGDLVIGLVRDTGIGIDESVRMQNLADKIIMEFPEVKTVFSRIGTPESATDPMGVNFSDTFVILKKNESRTRTRDELYAAIAERISKELPGHELSPTQPIEMRFNEILEGSRADVALRIYGPDLEKLMTYIEKSTEIISKIEGVDEAEMDSLTALRKSPMLDIQLDYHKMASLGVNLSEANSALEMAMGGIQVGNFYEVDRRFPIVLHLAEELREHRANIEALPIGLGDGGSIPLRNIAAFHETEQVTTIARGYMKRYAAVSIFLKNRDVASFVKEAKAKIESELKPEAGYTVEWGGQFKNLEKARLRLLLIVPLTIAAILLILFVNFGSIRLTLLVATSMPFAVTGGVCALALRGIPFSISAGVGFIALLGIAVLNSMVLVEFIRQQRLEGHGLKESVVNGAITRLRPVLMTAIVAGLGFLPMALNTGMGAEVQRPLATVVIGGLITSTLLTLLLLPALYIRFAPRKSNAFDG
ncbi:CusA/CzcA family heavy metal efflux RND transporter [soil metagenome]